jgi:hypothetical protein
MFSTLLHFCLLKEQEGGGLSVGHRVEIMPILPYVKNHPSYVRNGTFLSTLKIFDFEWMGGM